MMFRLIPNSERIRTMMGMISSRPIHMLIISMDLAIGSMAISVIPAVRPTLPCAEHTSKMMVPSVWLGYM